MTNRRMLTLILIANLLTVALVTGAFQAVSLLAEGPSPQTSTIQPTNHDPFLAPWVPSRMNYQGILKDGGGNPLNGQHDLTFTIYRWDQTNGKQSYWTETHTDVQITDGLFNEVLGSKGTPLTAAVFTGLGVKGTWDGDTELAVKVDGGTELSPTVSLYTVPYAHRSEYVNRFPAPHYDSDWVDPPTVGDTVTKNHNLGGSVDDYVVDLQFKDTRNPGSLGIHQFGYGGNTDDVAYDGTWGAWWDNLTTSQITVSWGGKDEGAGQVRVRIWRIE